MNLRSYHIVRRVLLLYIQCTFHSIPYFQDVNSHESKDKHTHTHTKRHITACMFSV